MKFALDVGTRGVYADARVLAQLALEAEEAGWDGFFIWDVLLGKEVVIDPWIALTAIALKTNRIKIGLLAHPLARHRPWLTAVRLANLDQLSGGRVICTVGLGHIEGDFAAFGEASEARVRAVKLDEGLAILTGLWREEAFSFVGEHYRVEQVQLPARPVQAPRIPLWIVGGWPRHAPLRRAAKWDGVCFKAVHDGTGEWLTLNDFREARAYVLSQHTHQGAFDIVMSGETPCDPREAYGIVQPFREAGATWWVEGGYDFTLDEFQARIRSGPPRV